MAVATPLRASATPKQLRPRRRGAGRERAAWAALDFYCLLPNPLSGGTHFGWVLGALSARFGTHWRRRTFFNFNASKRRRRTK